MHSCTHLLINATTIDAQGNSLKNQAIAIKKGLIEWCGDQVQLPAIYKEHAQQTHDCRGRLVTPGLIDCHTHLVYAGSRASEFHMKQDGLSYEEIARAGGGILSTVQQTRAAFEEDLLEQSLPRMLHLANEGITTVEIKSGYGLDMTTERKMLRVAKRLGELTGVRVRTTFLGAHAVPVEFKNAPQAYVDYLCNEMLPTLHAEGLVDAVDIFTESIGFSLGQTQELFLAAQALNIPVKCHAEQLSNMGASVLAAEYKALSCDHLEYIDANGVQAMAKANTIAVLLPGAFYFLGEKKVPPVDLLRRYGVGMAIATDCNPGSSPTASLLLMMSMACRFFSMTIPEVLSAVTYQAASALGLQDRIGSLHKGKAADLVLWSVSDSSDLCYYFAYPLSRSIMIAGEWVKRSQGIINE